MPHSWGQIPDFNLWANTGGGEGGSQSPVDPSTCAVTTIHVGM